MIPGKIWILRKKLWPFSKFVDFRSVKCCYIKHTPCNIWRFDVSISYIHISSLNSLPSIKYMREILINANINFIEQKISTRSKIGESRRLEESYPKAKITQSKIWAELNMLRLNINNMFRFVQTQVCTNQEQGRAQNQ